MQLCLFLFVAVMLGACLVDAKKMWGSRKKRDEVLEESVVAPPKTAYKPSSSRRSSASRKRFNIDDAGDTMDASNLSAMFAKYLNTFEEVVDSEDFGTYMDASLVRQVIEQVPGASETPEVAAMLTMIESSDSETLRALIKEGIKTVKSSTDEIIALLTDPQKMAELLAQLPPEVRKVVKAVQSGDVTALKDLVMNQPGLEHSQKSLLMGLLDGNTELLTRELRKALSDDSQIEAARQQMLEHPEIAEAFGVSEEVLQDAARWAQMMAESADTLLSQLDGATAAGAAGGAGGDGERVSDSFEALRTKFNSRRSVLGANGDAEEGQGQDQDQVEDFLKKLKSKLGRAA